MLFGHIWIGVVGDHHLDPFGGQLAGNARANTLAASGDHRDAPFELQFHAVASYRSP